MMTPQRICIEALRDKYCVAGESEAIDVQRRVARALASVGAGPCAMGAASSSTRRSAVW